MKRGRPKNIETPEIMEKLFNDYIEQTKSTPILKHTFVGKDGKSVYEKRERALTMDGFELFCYDNGYGYDLHHYFTNYQGRYEDFVPCCTHIRKKIKEDQIQGGLAGVYNTSITQRLNGLTEKSEMIVKEQPLFGDVKTDAKE
ncbi:MAG: hypothetical protein EBS86_08150 [Crocinitomicaceae bacterium]|nr:hypothetical protein [Crocinitomicaceae bacterium]